MLAVCLFDLIERLGDQESADAITGHEGKRTLEEVQTAERRELVEHHQKLMLASLRWVSVELLGQPTPDLIENEANEWLCPRNIRRRNDQIERGRMVGLNQVGDAPVAARCDRRDGRVAIDRKSVV